MDGGDLDLLRILLVVVGLSLHAWREEEKGGVLDLLLFLGLLLLFLVYDAKRDDDDCLLLRGDKLRLLLLVVFVVVGGTFVKVASLRCCESDVTLFAFVSTSLWWLLLFGCAVLGDTSALRLEVNNPIVPLFFIHSSMMIDAEF